MFCFKRHRPCKNALDIQREGIRTVDGGQDGVGGVLLLLKEVYFVGCIGKLTSRIFVCFPRFSWGRWLEFISKPQSKKNPKNYQVTHPVSNFRGVL